MMFSCLYSCFPFFFSKQEKMEIELELVSNEIKKQAEEAQKELKSIVRKSTAHLERETKKVSFK